MTSTQQESRIAKDLADLFITFLENQVAPEGLFEPTSPDCDHDPCQPGGCARLETIATEG